MPPFDFLVPIVAILMVGSMILVPIVGLTLRFAIKPSVEAIARAIGQSQGRIPVETGDARSRVRELEEELEAVRARLERVEAVQSFERQLTAGG